MSKFIFSNSDCFASLRKRNEENGYEVSGSITELDLSFMAFHKLKVKNHNFTRIGEDFIAITGTLFFNGLRDEELLRRVYNGYLERGESLRKDLRGNYAVIIKHANKIIVFGEETYFYDIFYYYNNGIYIVSNDLYEIFLLLKDVEIDIHNVLEQAYLNGIIGNETVLKGVSRLSGDQKIVIDIERSSLDVVQFPVDWSRLDIDCEQAVTLLSNNLKDIAKSISTTYYSTAICMTGGLDSRMSLASLLSIGEKPAMYYGKGNTPVTNTHDQDYDICKLFSEKYGLQLTKMDWRSPSPIDNDWDFTLGKYGILYHAYGGSEKVMLSLENIKEEFVTMGLVGELFRTLDFTENRTRFTIEDYVDQYYFQKNNAGKYISLLSDNFDSFRSRLIEKYISVCKRYNLDPNNMVVEDFFYLNLEYRANADNIMLNLLNRMRFCSWLLAAPEVLKTANISVKVLKGSYFMLSTLEQLCPSCLEVPVFSHQKEMVYNKKSKTLELPLWKRTRHALSLLMPKSVKGYLIAMLNKRSPVRTFDLNCNVKELCTTNGCRINELFGASVLDVTLLQYLYALRECQSH